MEPEGSLPGFKVPATCPYFQIMKIQAKSLREYLGLCFRLRI
jgi:hypothetical protein